MICKKHFVIKKNGKPGWECFCSTPELIEAGLRRYREKK